MFILVMKLIRMGKIDAALGKLRDWYPQIILVSCLRFTHIEICIILALSYMWTVCVIEEHTRVNINWCVFAFQFFFENTLFASLDFVLFRLF